MRDFKSNVAIEVSIAPQDVSGNVTGDPVDTLGFGSAGVCVVTGASTGFDASAVVEASDSTGSTTFEAVDTADLLGSFPEPLGAGAVAKVSYIGPRRFVRVVLDHDSGTVPAVATVMLGKPSQAPVDDEAED